jgi:hypothetical protein
VAVHPVATVTITVARVRIVATMVVMTVMMPVVLVGKNSADDAERETGDGVARAISATNVDHVVRRSFLDRDLAD